MIPMVMRLVIKDEKTRGVNLWLPLFLVWILLLPLFVVTALVWAFFRLFGAGAAEVPRVARFIEAGFTVIWKLNGLRIDIRSRESRFVMHF